MRRREELGLDGGGDTGGVENDWRRGNLWRELGRMDGRRGVVDSG